MSRMRSALLTLGILGGCVAAFVQAQELSGRPEQAGATLAGAPGAFAEDSQTRPIGEPRSTPTNRRRNLADRLRAARGGAQRGEPQRDESQNHSHLGPARQSITDAPIEQRETSQFEPTPLPARATVPEQPVEEEAPPLAPEEPAEESVTDSPVADVPELPPSANDSETLPPARSAALPSVLKRGPNAWRSSAASSPSDAPAAIAEEQDEPRLTEAPNHEIGSGRIPPTLQPAKQQQDVAASSELPPLRVQTTGPGAVRLGKESTWRIEIENAGANAANDVVVSIHLPPTVEVVATEASLGEAGAQATPTENSVLTWRVPQLAARSQARLEVRAIPKAAGAFELRADWTCRPNPIAAQVEVQEPKLEISIAGPAEVHYGDTQLYTVVFSNPGTGDAEDINVSLAPLAGGDRAGTTSNIGMIPAGSKKQMQVELVARQAGTMEIKLRATAEGGLEAETARQIKVKRAQLQVGIRGPRMHYAGAVASYRVSVTNVGDSAAQDVTLAAVLPVGAKPAGKSAGSTNWEIGDLAPGAEREVEFSCEFTTGGECTISAHAEAAENLSAAAETITQVEAIADLKLQVNEPRGAQPVGDDAVYELIITNRGARAAQQVEVVAQFSEGIEPVAAAGAPAEMVTGQVIFKPLAQIAPGQSLALKITARAEQAGNLIFRAEVKCAEPETKLVSESTTRYFGDAAKP